MKSLNDLVLSRFDVKKHTIGIGTQEFEEPKREPTPPKPKPAPVSPKYASLRDRRLRLMSPNGKTHMALIEKRKVEYFLSNN
jgi:hypothetical protein